MVMVLAFSYISLDIDGYVRVVTFFADNAMFWFA